MANAEVFDDEFYQEDFSTATEFEAFLCGIQDFLDIELNENEEGPLSKNCLSYCDWSKESEENISFNEFDLIMTRYRAKISSTENSTVTKKNNSQVFADIISFENDFCILDDGKSLKDEFVLLNEPQQRNIHPIARWYGLRDFIVISSKKKNLLEISQVSLIILSTS